MYTFFKANFPDKMTNALYAFHLTKFITSSKYNSLFVDVSPISNFHIILSFTTSQSFGILPILVSLNSVCPMPSEKSFCIKPFFSSLLFSMILSVVLICSSTVESMAAIFCCSGRGGKWKSNFPNIRLSVIIATEQFIL